jgi:hypothetical protein
VNSDKLDQQNFLLWLLLLYYAVYIACAILLQLESGELPSTPGTAIDKLTGSLLWMMSIVAILLAVQRLGSPLKILLWLTVSAAAGALAIDEVFEFHERTKSIVGDDDYIKIVFWACAAIGSYVLYKVEKPTKTVAIVFISGFLFQTLYLLVDTGDGDFYSLPIPIAILHWMEEILETLAMQGYLAGLLLHLTLQTNGPNYEHTLTE